MSGTDPQPDVAVALLDCLGRLDDVLDQGAHDRLATLAPRMEELMSLLVSQPGRPADLRELAARAGRVLRRLEAAAQGLRAARRRIEEIRGAAAGSATYDGNGRRMPMTAGAVQLHRRA